MNTPAIYEKTDHKIVKAFSLEAKSFGKKGREWDFALYDRSGFDFYHTTLVGMELEDATTYAREKAALFFTA